MCVRGMAGRERLYVYACVCNCVRVYSRALAYVCAGGGVGGDGELLFDVQILPLSQTSRCG